MNATNNAVFIENYDTTSTHSRKFTFKKTVLALSIGVVCAVSAMRTGATGFPTVDIAQVMQNIMEYEQELTAYSTQIEQKAIQVSQLTQAINTYQQLLTDYNHYLTLTRGLKDYIDSNSLNSIAKAALWDDANNPFSGSFDPTIYTSSGMVNINNELKRIYNRSRQLSNMDSDITSIGGSTELNNRAQFSYERSQLAATQTQQVETNAEEINKNIATNDELEDALNSVQDTPESQVATLQLMATQNQAIQANLQTIAKISNQQLNYSNQLPGAVFGSLAKSEDAEITRLKNAHDNPPTAVAQNFNTF